MNYDTLVTVDLNGAETKAAAAALRTAEAANRDKGRPNVADEKVDYAAAFESAYTAFGGITVRITVQDAMEIANGISYGRRANNDSTGAMTDALASILSVVDEVLANNE